MNAHPEFPKQCGCGREHSASEWALLPFVGWLSDQVETLELRNCACFSTLAIVVEAPTREAA